MRGLEINYMGRGNINIYSDIATTRLKRPKDRFGEIFFFFFFFFKGMKEGASLLSTRLTPP